MQSQLHKHHASTEWQRVLYTESLCSRGERERQKDNRCELRAVKEGERETETDREKRYKDPKDRIKKAERANTNRVIAA